MTKLSDLTGGGGLIPQVFMNNAIQQWAKQDFTNSMQELGYNNGMFDIFRDESKIASSSQVVITDLANDADADGKIELDYGNIISKAYTGNNFSVNTQEDYPKSMFFKPDGFKVFVIGSNGGNVYAYDLNTAWDISSASYNSENFDYSSQISQGHTLHFNSDGSKMFLSDGNSTIYAYDLGTNWDVSSAIYNSESYTIQDTTYGMEGLSFNSDGSKMFTCENLDYVYAYDLSTPWDISTASYNSENFNYGNNLYGVSFANSGKLMLLMLNSSNIKSYVLETAYDVSTATYRNTATFSEESAIEHISVGDSDNKVYTIGTGNDTIYEYNLTDGLSSYASSGSLTSTTKDLGFTPSTIILSDEIVLNSETINYTIEDGNANTVTVNRTDIDSEVDLSSFTSSVISIKANLSQSGGNTPILYSYAAYFQE